MASIHHISYKIEYEKCKGFNSILHNYWLHFGKQVKGKSDREEKLDGSHWEGHYSKTTYFTFSRRTISLASIHAMLRVVRSKIKVTADRPLTATGIWFEEDAFQKGVTWADRFLNTLLVWQQQLCLWTATSSGSKGGTGWGMPPTRLLAGPCLSPPVLCLISHSSSFDWHLQQITFSQQKFKRFEDFLATVLTIFTSLCCVW